MSIGSASGNAPGIDRYAVPSAPGWVSRPGLKRAGWELAVRLERSFLAYKSIEIVYVWGRLRVGSVLCVSSVTIAAARAVSITTSQI